MKSASNAGDLVLVSSDRVAKPKPSSRLPASPRNIRAGGKLWGRNPRQAPMKMAEKSIVSGWLQRCEIARIATPAMAATPAASPSRPSIRFIAFISARYQATVGINPQTPTCTSPPSGLLINSTRTPAAHIHSAIAV
ncbi:MAG: hypothetical protein BWZ10_03517 [candidate division BRC1 bacterium ADurb.BinA364]|nr:MAG: hypothetical protein BWZ10_03517 [candidate division BRC1 bacterium ADurb.BinA364]